MALNVNSVVLAGRITKDLEVRKTPTGISTVTFTVAVDRPLSRDARAAGQQAQADFISCVAWRSSADFLGAYAHKGSEVVVEGRISTRSYDGQDGKKVYVTEVIANNVSLPSGGGGRTTGGVTPAPVTTGEPELNISSDDLPF